MAPFLLFCFPNIIAFQMPLPGLRAYADKIFHRTALLVLTHALAILCVFLKAGDFEGFAGAVLLLAV